MVILEYVFYFVVLGWKSITETADYLIQGCIGIVVGICVLASPAATPFVVVTGVFAYGVGMLAFSYTKKLALNSDPDPIMYYIICGLLQVTFGDTFSTGLHHWQPQFLANLFNIFLLTARSCTGQFFL